MRRARRAREKKSGNLSTKYRAVLVRPSFEGRRAQASSCDRFPARLKSSPVSRFPWPGTDARDGKHVVETDEFDLDGVWLSPSPVAIVLLSDCFEGRLGICGRWLRRACFLRLHRSCVERLRRRLPAQLLDPPARLHQHEERELFAAFAYHEPGLPNKLLGLSSRKTWPNLSLSFPYPYWASLGAASAEGCSRSRGRTTASDLLCRFRDRRSSRFRNFSYSNRPERSACSRTALVGVLLTGECSRKEHHMLSGT